MKRPKLLLLIALVLIALPCGLWGATTISATYVSEPYLYLQQAPGAFTHPSVVGAKLGRLTIIFSGGSLYNPGIQTSGSGGYGNVVLSGLIANCPDCPFQYANYINMAVVLVTYVGTTGSTPYVRTMYNAKQSLFLEESNVEITTSPVYVDFYLVNTNSSGRERTTDLPANLDTGSKKFDLTTQYTFNSPFNPTYALGVTQTSNGGLWQIPTSGEPTNPNAFFVEIDGVAGSGTTPFLGDSALSETAGDNNDQTGFWNGCGEIPQPVNFLFSFLYNTVNFDLSDAYTGKPNLYLNTARMEVQNGVTGTTYKQKITFSDIWGGPTFQLKPDADSDGIDFYLVFGSKLVDYGVADNWENLVPGPNNTKDLYIRGIDSSQVNQCVSGEYSDTIIVNITAADN